MPFQFIHDDIERVCCDARIEAVPDRSGQDTGARLIRLSGAPDPLGEGSDCRPGGSYVISAPLCEHLPPKVRLRYCWRDAMRAVRRHGFGRVAVPLIGAGEEGFDDVLVLQAAMEALRGFLPYSPDTAVFVVVRDMRTFRPDPAALSRLDSFIRYIRTRARRAKEQAGLLDGVSTGAFSPVSDEELELIMRWKDVDPDFGLPDSAYDSPFGATVSGETLPPVEAPAAAGRPFSDGRPPLTAKAPGADRPRDAKPGVVLPFDAFGPEGLPVLEESFSQMVLRKVDEKGYKKDSEVYIRANIHRRVFSRLRCDRDYHPRKTTAVALAVALELPINETNELLRKAGYSLSRSILFDVIVEHCILERNYDVTLINQLLFRYGQPLLGDAVAPDGD